MAIVAIGLVALETGVASAAGTPATLKPGPVPKSPAQPHGLTTMQDGYGPTPQQQAALSAAAAQARTSGKGVTVDSLTTETAQITAQPKGGFSLESSPEPVRANQNGTWTPVDTTLHRNANGSLAPAATAYGTVTLSGGGTAPLAVTTSGATTYTVSWPTALPAPTVHGNTATYANVLPGVDLQASATVTGGFSEVLVVRNAQAASNPALAKLELPTTVTGGKAVDGDAGGVAVRGSNTLTASTPFMWDSNVSVPATNKAQLAPDASDTAHPGQAARMAPIQTHVTSGKLTLTPDKHLLTDKSTVFPIYLDPSFNWHSPSDNMSTPAYDEVKQGAPCTNTSFYNTSDDQGYMAVGVNDFAGFTCLGIMRTYYQWSLPSVIWGAHIGNVSGQPGATVNATKVYSGTCSTGTINLHWAGGIGPGTSWNSQPGYGGSIAQQSFGPVRSGCSSGSNQWITHGFDVTGAIAQSAAAHAGQITFALTDDGGERAHSDAGYSRFTHTPTLQIFFNRAPNTPGANELSAASGADNAGCATSTPYPYMGKAIATNTPVLSSHVSDVDGDHLQAKFQYWVEGSGQNTGLSADNIGSGGTAQFSLPNSFVSSLSNGQVVDWQVQVTDGIDWSGWSTICHFIAEPTAPSAPSVISTDGKYPSNGTVGAVSGTPGRFTVASTGGTVSKLVDGYDEVPPKTNPPSADVMTLNGSAAISGAGRWKLSDGSGTTAADSVGNAPATLNGTTSWTTDPSRGKVLTLNGNGFAATNGPVIKTDGSFTVSVWVNGASATSSGAVLGQDSVFASGFYVENIDGKWSFSKLASDTVNAAAIRAESTNAPQPGVWTHLAGVYDAATGKMTLYVNGQAQGTATDTTPYSANGPFTIGRAQWNASVAPGFTGSISDVQAYQAALSPSDIAQIYAGNTVGPVGLWRTVDGSGTTLADSSGGNHPVTLSGSTGWTAPTDDTPAATFNTGASYGVANGPVLNTQSSFTVSAWAKLNDLKGYYAVVSQKAAHTSGFQIRYSPDVKAWIFGMPTVDSSGDNYQWAYVDNSVQQAGQWTQVTGVYDAAAKQISLYVNGNLVAQKAITTVIPASGAFLIGGTFFNDGMTASFNGSISGVQAYQTALSGSEVSQMFASATRSYTPSSPGPHTFYAYATDPAGDASGTQAYPFVAAGDPSVTCASLAACFNNTSISPDSNRTLANADGANSISATDLTNAGWASGGTVSVNGGTFTLPQFGGGQPDNVLAANQTVTYNRTVPAVGASSLEFLTTATTTQVTKTPGAVNGNTTAPYVPAGTAVASSYCFDSTQPAAWCAPKGTIHYADGTSQPYDLIVPDWVVGPSSLAAITLPHRNEPGGQNGQLNTKLYAFSVPVIPGKTITSVTLPDVGAGFSATQALHIYSMATRDTTVASAGKTWTGSWAAPTEGLFANTTGGSFGNQTFREVVKPSLTGDSVRIKLDNALSTVPMTIGHATVALSDGTDVPSTTPTDLKFGGSLTTTIPGGGMAYSDELPFTVPAGKSLVVSFELNNTVQLLPTHVWSSNNAKGYLSAAGSGDHTTDSTDAAFQSYGSRTNLLTEVDVTSGGVPTQAVVGDGFIDQAQTGHAPSASTNMADIFTATESTTPSPYGSLAEGIESNQVMADYPEANGGGPSLLSRIDRDVLDLPGLNTVVLDEGLEDVLAGRASTDLTANGLTTLVSYLHNSGITFVGMGLTPCLGYAGDGANPNNACTNTVDDQRVATNRWLSAGAQATPNWFYVDADSAVGVPDSSGTRVQLNSAADGGDHVNLTDAGFGALASSYLGSQDTWKLDDGATTSDPTIAADSANSGTNPYLLANPAVGANPATLAGSATWAADSTVGEALSLDGSSGYAASDGSALDTTKSFSVSAWVNPSSLPSNHAAVLAQDGQHSSAFVLFYNASSKSWNFAVSPTDAPTVNLPCAIAPGPAAANTWTHLVGVYNAVTKTEQLYVNGTLANQVANVTSFAASGPFSIGRYRWNDANSGFFPGKISDAQAWNYALTPTQISALYKRVS